VVLVPVLELLHKARHLTIEDLARSKRPVGEHETVDIAPVVGRGPTMKPYGKG
jgi:hypothetical protein